MKINWFTVIAQVINFLVLVWLLKKFLYKPVLSAIDAREKKIAARLEDAKSKKAEARKEQEEFEEKNKQFDAQKKELMDKAIADTKTQKDKLLETARGEVDALKAKQQKAIADIQENMAKDLAQRLQQEVFDVSRKTLTDLASVSLEEQATKLFLSRLTELKDGEKKQFTDAFKAVSKPILIQSAFDLPEQQQAAIKKAVDEILGAEPEFEFKTAPDIIGGIELAANGYKLDWSISAYLSSMQDALGKTMKEKPVPAAKPATDKKPEPAKP